MCEESLSEMVSIIMPAYNSSKFISRGIESCINQSYRNWELLVVDDGSTDDTQTMVSRFCSKDRRIHYFYQANGGVSLARNKGLDEARGEYIVFLDSDDWLRKDAIERMVILQRTHLDMLIACNRRVVQECQYDLDALPMDDKIAVTVLDRQGALENTGTQKYNNSSVNKIFRRDLIERMQLRFDSSLSYGEDGVFVFQYLFCVDGMYHYDDCLWYLLDRKGSTTRRGFSDKNLSALNSVEKMREILAEYSCLENTRDNTEDVAILAERRKTIDQALQIYGGSIAYNLVRLYAENDTIIPEAEKILKLALRRYKNAYRNNDLLTVLKYNLMTDLPLGIYRKLYRLTHKERL